MRWVIPPIKESIILLSDDVDMIVQARRAGHHGWPYSLLHVRHEMHNSFADGSLGKYSGDSQDSRRDDKFRFD